MKGPLQWLGESKFGEYQQNCQICGSAMRRTSISSTTWGWMHTQCMQIELHRQAAEVLEKNRAQEEEEVVTHQVSGTRDEFHQYQRQNPSTPIIVIWNPDAGRSRRYTWWVP